MNKLVCFFFTLSLFAQNVTPGHKQKQFSGTYTSANVGGAATIPIFRPVQFLAGTYTFVPATPTSLVYGITASTSTAGTPTYVIISDQWPCEFDSTPTVGDLVGVSSGSLCTSLGATTLSALASSVSYVGRVYQLDPTDCTTCAWIQVEGINKTGSLSVKGYLTGTTGSIGGGLLLAGATSSGTVTVSGATTAMGCNASPVSGNPSSGLGISVNCKVTSANTVTVWVGAVIAGTPAASTYAVTVFP